MMPRYLRLLQIDDDLRHPRPASEFIQDISIGSENKYGINDWETSIEFWNQYERNRRIDLITADVRFTADKTTPLLYDSTFRTSENAGQYEEFLIPTGLSHLKPLAAIARDGGRPFGIAVHTADVLSWKAILASKNPVARAMAYLAAHEIGELAAILGHRPNFSTLSNNERLEACWSWLSHRTYTAFDQAWGPALQSFRENLIGRAFTARTLGAEASGSEESRLDFIVVLPDEWTKLAAWCERMAAPEREAILKDDDPGFSFILPDGSRDSIYFRSLFADAHMSLHGNGDFNAEPLPPKCFRVETSHAPSILDEAGYPQIGPFLMEFRDLTVAYDRVIRALDEFPLNMRADIKLGDVLSPSSCGSLFKLARFLAVLFQIVRRDRSLVEMWEVAYQTRAWDVADACFRTESFDTCMPSLKQMVLRVYDCAARFGDGFTGEMLYDAANCSVRNGAQMKVSRKTTDLCIRLLESLFRIFYRDEDGEYDLNIVRPISDDVPPVPAVIPRGLTDEDDVRSQELGPFLRDVFGYGGTKNPNDNQIGRFIAEALGVDTRKGREFLSEFQDGRAPMWIKEICRMYAINKLLWPYSESWPRVLKSLEREFVDC
jgi:hypothetical protein